MRTKKFFIIALMGVLFFSMSACGKKEAAVHLAETDIPDEEKSQDKESEKDREKTDDSKDSIEALKDESMEAYERFLSNDELLYFDFYNAQGYEEDFAMIYASNIKYEEGRGYSLSDYLSEKIYHNISEINLYEYTNLMHAYIDCGNDGIPELSLSYSLVGEMSQYEGDYEITDVIKYIDGRLEFCAEATTHYRAYRTVFGYGIISDSYIDYAGGDVNTGITGIDRDGVIREILYSTETSGASISSVYDGYSYDGKSEPDFSDMADWAMEFGYDSYIHETDIKFGSKKGEQIYSYSSEFDVPEKDRGILFEKFNEAGIELLEFERYNEIIDGVYREFGLEPEQVKAGVPEYKAIELDMDEEISSDPKEANEWKKACRRFLKGFMNDEYYFSVGMGAESYSQAGKAYVALLDITEDDVPELLISLNNYGQWNVYCFNGSDYERSSLDGMVFYDSENHKIYAKGYSSFEGYYVYKVEKGEIVYDCYIGEGDVEGADGSPYFVIDADDNNTDIPKEEMEAFRNAYNLMFDKYRIEGELLTEESPYLN